MSGSDGLSTGFYKFLNLCWCSVSLMLCLRVNYLYLNQKTSEKGKNRHIKELQTSFTFETINLYSVLPTRMQKGLLSLIVNNDEKHLRSRNGHSLGRAEKFLRPRSQTCTF